MKRFSIIGSLLVILSALVLSSCVMLQTRHLRSEKSKIYSLVSVGQNINDAEMTLRQAGYKLTHATAIHVTKNKDYVQQIVQIGDGLPTASDTFFYTITGGDNPLRLESDHVVIEAGNDHIITKVE